MAGSEAEGSTKEDKGLRVGTESGLGMEGELVIEEEFRIKGGFEIKGRLGVEAGLGTEAVRVETQWRNCKNAMPA